MTNESELRQIKLPPARCLGGFFFITRKAGAANVEIRWDENAGLRRDAISSQVIDALEAQGDKETGNEED